MTTLQGFQLWSGAIPLSWAPSITEDLESQGYELGNVIGELGLGTLYHLIGPAGLGEGELAQDNESFYVALQFDDVGPQIDDELSIGLTVDSNFQEEYPIYEAYYSYPVNDAMTITPGVIIEEAQDEDHTGFMIATSFSF